MPKRDAAEIGVPYAWAESGTEDLRARAMIKISESRKLFCGGQRIVI